MPATLLLCSALCLGLPALSDEPRTVWDYFEDFGRGMNLDAPRDALQRADVERWAEILTASEAQRQFMLVQYETFVQKNNEFIEREAAPYLTMAAELSDLGREEGVNSPTFVHRAKALDEASVRIRRELTSFEHALIDSFAVVLTPEQADRLGVLRNDATRRNCRSSHGYGRWLDVELRDVWNRSGAAIATAAEAEQVSVLLANHEARLTALVCDHAAMRIEMRQSLAENRLHRAAQTITFAQSRDRVAEIMADRVAGVRRIRALNEQTMRQISAVVSEDAAASFVEAAKREVFPELYPDPSALHELFATLIADEEISEAKRQEVNALREAYAIQYALLGEEIEAFCNEWSDRTLEGRDGYRPQFLPAALEPLLEKREELARAMLAKVDAVLDVED